MNAVLHDRLISRKSIFLLHWSFKYMAKPKAKPKSTPKVKNMAKPKPKYTQINILSTQINKISTRLNRFHLKVI